MFVRFKKKQDTAPKTIVNNSVKICVECGSTTVLINRFGMCCKDCNSQFRVRKDGKMDVAGEIGGRQP